jgi:hypothetical protein
MCVTSGPAFISGTKTYAYAAPAKGGEPQRHVCGYINTARSTSGPNCMFLNFAGSDLRLVRGPERTQSFMGDMTAGLPELKPVERSRSGSYRSSSIEVIDYGDYTTVTAQEPDDMLGVLDQVPLNRRPQRTPRLEAMVNFYMSYRSDDAFTLGCFDGNVKPKHPIVVSYTPHNPEVLTIPGLDGHDGKLPTVGAPVFRNFSIAFGVAGTQLPREVHYNDEVDRAWAPSSITGFVDNREDGPNGDYVMPVRAVTAGYMGARLARELVNNF